MRNGFKCLWSSLNYAAYICAEFRVFSTSIKPSGSHRLPVTGERIKGSLCADDKYFSVTVGINKQEKHFANRICRNPYSADCATRHAPSTQEFKMQSRGFAWCFPFRYFDGEKLNPGPTPC